MKSIRVSDRTRLAYRLLGPKAGPTVVLCDGIACDGFVWRYLLPELTQRYRVLHVHYRAHGRSGLPRDLSAVTIPHLTRDLTEIMDRLEVAPATFFGHSMGVQVVLEMAWRYPDRVRAGVLLCGSYGRALDTFKGTDVGARALPRIRELVERYRDPIAATVRAFVPTRLGWEVALMTELNRTHVRREDFMPWLRHVSAMPIDVFLTMLADAAERTTEHFLPRVEQPMLVVAGENDGFTPAYTALHLRDNLPEVDYEMVVGGTHTAPIEFPELVNRSVRQFMRRRGLAEPLAAPPRPRSLAARWRERAAAAPR